MMSAQPAYHMHADGTNAVLEGQEQVKSLYRLWAETNQSIFYAEGEEVAVAVLCVRAPASMGESHSPWQSVVASTVRHRRKNHEAGAPREGTSCGRERDVPVEDKGCDDLAI